VNFVTQQLAQKYQAGVDTSITINYQVANGFVEQSLGTCLLSVQGQEMCAMIPLEFNVVSKLPRDIIIGMEGMATMDVLIRAKYRSIIFHNDDGNNWVAKANRIPLEALVLVKVLNDMETSIDFDEIPAFVSKLEPAEPIVFDINPA
jgi:hypothetical protein